MQAACLLRQAEVYETERLTLAELGAEEVGICDVSDEAWKKDIRDIGDLSLDFSGACSAGDMSDLHHVSDLHDHAPDFSEPFTRTNGNLLDDLETPAVSRTFSAGVGGGFSAAVSAVKRTSGQKLFLGGVGDVPKYDDGISQSSDSTVATPDIHRHASTPQPISSAASVKVSGLKLNVVEYPIPQTAH